jgi:hypothetical protein
MNKLECFNCQVFYVFLTFENNDYYQGGYFSTLIGSFLNIKYQHAKLSSLMSGCYSGAYLSGAL